LDKPKIINPARTPPSNASSMLEIASFNETPAKI
jgi:hypothetical protein